jgi:PAS domain S-box-containing protein
MWGSEQNQQSQVTGESLLQSGSHKKSARALKDSIDTKKLLQNILDCVDEGIALVGLDGRVLDCNKASLKLTGLTREEFIGTNIYYIVVPEDRPRVIEGALKVLETGKVLNSVSVSRKNNPAFYAEISLTAFYDKKRNPVNFIVVIRDLTDRKKSEAALFESEEKYRQLIDKLPEMIFEINVSERIVFTY